MAGDGNGYGEDIPANDNRPPDAKAAGNETDAAKQMDAVVLTIARLIGRRMAREDYEQAMRAANDNHDPSTR